MSPVAVSIDPNDDTVVPASEWVITSSQISVRDMVQASSAVLSSARIAGVSSTTLVVSQSIPNIPPSRVLSVSILPVMDMISIASGDCSA